MSFPQHSQKKDFNNHRLLTSTSAKQSLTAKTLLHIILTIAIVTVVSSFVSYLKVVAALKSQTLEQLDKYVLERGEREQAIFKLAEDNHAVFKQELLKRLQQAGNQDPKQEFEQLFVKQQDGVIRNRPEKFDGRTQVGVYIGKGVNVTPEIRRRVKTLYDLTGDFGPAWHNRFQDLYFTTPENIIVIYWPEFPTWVQDAKADLNLLKEEFYVLANKQNNPERKLIWTSFYYDIVSKKMLVSCETPVEFNGRDLGIIGHDILIDELQQRLINDHIKDGYNILFRDDGRLIAHPKLMDKIKEKGGNLNILDSDDRELKEIYQLVKNKPKNQLVIDDPQQSNFIAVTKLAGPGWNLVTVLPKSTLTQKAFETAWSILLLGLIGLLVVSIVVFLILRDQISAPLKNLIFASNKIATGDFNIAIANNRQDELGILSDSFNIMAKEVETRTKALQKALQQQAASVYQTKVTMDELNISSHNSAEQAEEAAAGAKQVITLVNGSNSDINNVVSLREKMEQLTEQVFYLSEQSRQIGTISTLVSELANQTNMLAINAAVEAVRAGENGKGFAVVASEIRRLADQSKKSAEQINALVTDIQKSTNSTVLVNEEGRKIVESVVQAINNMLTNSQSISLNAQQQAVAIAQVVEAMNALNQIALQNSSIMND